ncbi:hypothetical protein V1227_16420 [Lentzea sp. DG1S-22]|uniref:hypothetical protein n=1 Tax=Lentzea sp. DG1S-22 TaxID=3108822 RepID=UPI002E77B50E|nr:hypothetical protein [Lentzea sp. DG1S-22]WVH84265.1 hypothetical protein V1227_16420 [Lentzea sp. DG1S-22]
MLVELKRPMRLTMTEFGQTNDYASAITAHPEVLGTPQHRDFWLVRGSEWRCAVFRGLPADRRARRFSRVLSVRQPCSVRLAPDRSSQADIDGEGRRADYTPRASGLIPSGRQDLSLRPLDPRVDRITNRPAETSNRQFATVQLDALERSSILLPHLDFSQIIPILLPRRFHADRWGVERLRVIQVTRVVTGTRSAAATTSLSSSGGHGLIDEHSNARPALAAPAPATRGTTVDRPGLSAALCVSRPRVRSPAAGHPVRCQPREGGSGGSMA